MHAKIVTGPYAAALALSAASPALAACQWTEGAMSRKQVEDLAASKHLPITISKQSTADQLELNTTYSTIGFTFEVRLIFFKSERLSEVVLVHRQFDDCETILSALKSAYGATYDSRVSSGGYSTWSCDAASHNDVTFRELGSVGYPNRWCDINYTQLTDPKSIGL